MALHGFSATAELLVLSFENFELQKILHTLTIIIRGSIVDNYLEVISQFQLLELQINSYFTFAV